jgi:phosphohistidine phosphatase
MKRLILVRHAKSSLNQPLVSDHQRILNQSGKNEAKLIGQYLSNNQYIPSHIISSTATRTLETANIVIEQLKFKNNIQTQSLIYTDSILNILNLINNIDNQYECVMLIGHNPTITELTNKISNINIDYMPTCGGAIIDFDCHWKLIRNNGNLIDFISPKKMIDN